MSAADVKECVDLGARMVLAESVVVVDTAVCALTGPLPWSGEIKGRPRGTSSDERVPSVEGRAGTGKDPASFPRISVLSLLLSMDGRVKFPAELDGRVGGDGGA